MTEERIYLLAWDSLIRKWGREHDFLEQHKDNEISQHRERQYWSELMELEALIREKGFNKEA